ncbi:MAG: formate dehydrogenase [Methanothermococcus sp.]|jgi:formate dehydrogenase subunit beta|uniref:Coenzyme F420 hydrogenase/dehydrogenase, beta subunit C-terminal domain n=1 Tax=Methanothermococcus TaxID=155862 RepID=UPI00038171FE|nr:MULTISPECIES: Coenzyme F420 hydrogenase/dehydrogenase, beta subunit C-terminal domain [Methanothermococcus]MDK2789877.1 formate dehydrogenase [Methanothermococcus sp.]MDK2987362.1 formate dehydrogenase [Methanothermococcus sp.]
MNETYYYVQAADEEILNRGECGGAVTALFKYLLDKKLVDGVLALKKGEDVYDGIPTLITSSEELLETAGSLHCAPVLWGKIIKNYLKDLKIAVPVKPCDMRAIVELAKRNQVNLDNIYMIGLNCGGTIPPKTAMEMIKAYYEVDPKDVVKEEIDKGKFIIELKDGTHKGIKIDYLEEEGYGRRTNCQRCEVKIPRKADLACGNWGVIGEDAGKWTFVEVCSEKGKELIKNAEKEGYIKTKSPSEKGIIIREKIENSMIKLGKKYQKKHLEEEYPNLTEWEKYWSRCMKCYGCRDACPICFCVECELNSEYMDKGEVPPNPLMFHGIRMSHTAFSCINCGQCEDLCPMEIPLAYIFHRLQLKIKDMDGYNPGLDDKLPPILDPSI